MVVNVGFFEMLIWNAIKLDTILESRTAIKHTIVVICHVEYMQCAVFSGSQQMIISNDVFVLHITTEYFIEFGLVISFKKQQTRQNLCKHGRVTSVFMTSKEISNDILSGCLLL